MWARVNTLQAPPERVDDAIRDVREQILPTQQAGRTGLLMLVDRTTGKGIGITFWESESAMRESEEQANQLREGTADRTGSRIVSVERYEVVIDERA